MSKSFMEEFGSPADSLKRLTAIAETMLEVANDLQEGALYKNDLVFLASVLFTEINYLKRKLFKNDLEVKDE